MSSIHAALAPLLASPSLESFGAICALFDHPLPDFDDAYAEAEQGLAAWPRASGPVTGTHAWEVGYTYRWTPKRWFAQVQKQKGVPPAWGLCRTLYRHGHGTEDRDIAYLVRSGALAKITDLNLYNGYLGPESFAALEGSGMRLEVFDTQLGPLGPEAEVLATSPAFSSLRRLEMYNCKLKDGMLLALAGSTTLTELTDLGLAYNTFSPAAWEALRHTTNLPRLRTLVAGYFYRFTQLSTPRGAHQRQMLQAPAPHIRRAWVRGMANQDLELLAADLGVKHKKRGYDREVVLGQILAAVDDGALDRVKIDGGT